MAWSAEPSRKPLSLTPAEPWKIEAHFPCRCCSCVRPCARAAYLVPSRPCRSSCPAASRPAELSLRCSRTKQFSRTVLDGSGGRDERSPTGPPRRLASWSWSEGGGRTVDPDCCSVRPSPPEPSGTGRLPNARASSGSACVSAPHVYSLKTGPNKQTHNKQIAVLLRGDIVGLFSVWAGSALLGPDWTQGGSIEPSAPA